MPQFGGRRPMSERMFSFLSKNHMRSDSCQFCNKQDWPCHDGRRFMDKVDEQCEGFELNQSAKNLFMAMYPKIVILDCEGEGQK